MKRQLITSTLMLGLAGCAGFGTGRNFLTENSESGSFFEPRQDFPIMAGDTGRVGERLQKTEEELQRDKSTYALERELVELENTQSDANLEFYNLHQKKFNSTSEKIYFLKLPKGERHDYLVAKGIIPEPKYGYSDTTRTKAINKSDVLMGMTKDDVFGSWGRPVKVEVAGNPSYENERWAYNVNGATKYIYFEAGKVDGWE